MYIVYCTLSFCNMLDNFVGCFCFGWKKPNQTHRIHLVQMFFFDGLIIACGFVPKMCERKKNALSYNDAQSIVCMGQAQNRLFLV